MRALTLLALGLLLFTPAATMFAVTWPGLIAPDTYSFKVPAGEVTWSAAGDLNGDGYPEVLFIDASYLQIMLNRGGTLTPGARYTVTTISRVLMADMNRDGRLDVVVVGGLTGVLLGKGDGTLQPGLFMYGPGEDAALGDFNGDGYPDLVTVGSPGVQVRMNDQKGGLGDLVTLPALPNPATRVLVADVNRDGVNDLVILNGHITVLPGKGDGTFGSAIVTGIAATAMAVADANHDGNADIYYTEESGAGVLLGNGDGTFRKMAVSPAGLNPQAISLGDFNGDGVMDMAVSSFGDGAVPGTAASGLTVLLGNPDCTFRVGKQYGFSGAQNPAVDLNGDGKLDLIIGGTAVALGNGDGTFRAVEQIGLGGRVAHSAVATADFNNDGSFEFAITGPGDQVEVLSQDAGRWSKIFVSGLQGWHVAAGDFDGDGNQDLIASSGDTAVSVARGNGDGSFSAVQTTSLNTSGDHLVATGRLNQDRFDDTVVLTGSTLELLMGREDGSFSAPITVALENGDGVRVLVADLNQDGFGDIVVQHGFGFSLLMGDSAGRYLDQRFLSASGRVGGMLLQDINGDTIPDLIYSAATLDKVFVLPGDGQGGFGTGASYSVLRPGDVRVGDINGDGLPDLIVGSNYAGLATLLGTPQHGFSAATYWYANVNQTDPVITDVNGDGVPDIVTLDPMAAVSLFINKGWSVQPSPMLTVSENSIDFGSQRMWSSSTSHNIKLINTGNLNLPLRFSIGGDFQIARGCGNMLPVAAACTFSVSFAPLRVGVQSDSLVINAGAFRTTLPLAGVGLDVSISPSRPSRESRNLPEETISSRSNASSANVSTRDYVTRESSSPIPQANVMLSHGIVSSRHSTASEKVSECACRGELPVEFTGPFTVEGKTSAAGGSDETASNSHLEGWSARGRRDHFNRQRRIRKGNLHRRYQRNGRTLHKPGGTPSGRRSRMHFHDGRKRTGQGRHYAGVHRDQLGNPAGPGRR